MIGWDLLAQESPQCRAHSLIPNLLTPAFNSGTSQRARTRPALSSRVACYTELFLSFVRRAFAFFAKETIMAAFLAPLARFRWFLSKTEVDTDLSDFHSRLGKAMQGKVVIRRGDTTSCLFSCRCCPKWRSEFGSGVARIWSYGGPLSNFF